MRLKASIYSSADKNTGDEDGKLIPNKLARHQFMDLLVKMATRKFGKSEDKNQPSKCVEHLIKTNILPSFTSSKVYGNPDKTKIWIDTELFRDRETH